MSDQDPNPNPDPSPAATERPDWLPENLWDATANKPVDFSVLRTPAADLPADANGYTLPELDGLDAEDPLVGIMRTRAFENGLGQEAFASVFTDYHKALTEADNAAYEKGLEVIGDNAKGRIDAVSTWLDSKLPKEMAGPLKGLATDPQAMLGLEKLMNLNATAAPRTQDAPPPARKSAEEIRSLMGSPKYSGKAHERDPAVIAEVTKWFQDEEAARQAAAKKP